MKITRAGAITVFVFVVAIVIGVGSKVINYIPKGNDAPAVVLPKTDTVHFTGNTSTSTETYSVAVPEAPSTTSGKCHDVEVIPWNAVGGLIYANGGVKTKPGSLVDKYTNGGCINLKLQADYGQMETNLAKSQDAFYVIMGDALGYVSLAQDALLPGGFEAVGVVGFSDGEDKCMLPAEALHDLQKMRGTLVKAVPEDGDWNVCVKKASDSGIPVNANGATYDPNAMNFSDADTFQHADEALISHQCEERELVKGDLDMNQKVTVCVNGVATWTPGDVDVVENYDGIANDIHGKPQKYGIVSVASTQDYRGQMPALLIGRKDFNRQHADLIVGLLKAADQGAQAINAGDLTSNGYQSNRALMQMGALNALVFQDKDADYWAKYFVGQVGTDRLGNKVKLGGSRVIGLREAADYFGLRPGTQNVFKGVYEIFTGYDKLLRPDLTPRVIPYNDIVNVTYLQQALQGVQLNTGVTNEVLAKPAPITEVVSNRVWKIEFDTGSANIRSESFATLMELAKQAGMTGLRIRIDGYTDNTGSAATNTKLSAARAEAVANWLSATFPADFPATRFQSIGHGPANPIGNNATAEGKQQNRRVEIAFGN